MAVPVILIPILAMVFSPSDYRILSIFQMLITFFGIFMGFQSISSVVRFVKNDDRDVKADQLIISSSFYIFCVSIFIFIFFIFFTQNFLSDFLKISKLVIWMSFLVANLYFVWQLYLNYCQAKENGGAYFTSTIFHALISLVLTLIIIGIGSELNERILAIIISAILVAVISYIKMGSSIKEREWNYDSIKKNLLYGFYLIPHCIFVFSSAFIDKIYINTYFSEVVAGSYFLMFVVSQVCLLIPTAINLTFRPWLFNNCGDSKKMESILKQKNIYLALNLVAFASALIAVFAYLILSYIGEKNSYQISGSVFFILCISVTIDGIYLFPINLILFLEKTKTVSLITFLSLFFTVVLLSFLGPLYGMLGAAISCLFGSVSRCTLSFIVGIRGIKRYHLQGNIVKG